MRGDTSQWGSVTRVIAACALAVAVVTPAGAERVKPVNGDIALHGYDAVAYFTDGRPTKGSKEFEHQWNGATWRFVSKANRDAFIAMPEKYAPQFGGYCAYAVSQGHTADTDPEAFSIVNGRLYLNYSKSVKKEWDTDQQGYIEKGNANWPKIVGK